MPSVSSPSLRLAPFPSSPSPLLSPFVLFESATNSRWFVRTSIILFLNKIDVFRETLRKTNKPGVWKPMGIVFVLVICSVYLR
ncbi:hypothetical protein B0H11DRAFT_2294003 [Mycena galericulata]|nr:hypothetical protein B0H11DRAFT_2294003 [Mycena galericulata]